MKKGIKTNPMLKDLIKVMKKKSYENKAPIWRDIAKRFEIPYRLEPLPRHSGTDAKGLQIARAGIPTMVISIPLRYMHTPVEIISMKDVKRTGRLLAEFITGLAVDFMDNLSLDDE